MSRKSDRTSYGDGLPESLARNLRRETLRLDAFEGLDTLFGGGNVITAGVNLSPRRAPALATRPPRGLYVYDPGSGRPHGMIRFDNSLIYARGSQLFRVTATSTIVSLGTVEDSDKQFIIFGDHLYIYPDKLFLARGEGMPKPLELDTGVIEQADFRGSTVTLPRGMSWTALGFGPGDGLRVVNADDVNPTPEGYYRITELHGQTATLAQTFSGTCTGSARFRRVVPALERCCVSGDRIYGIVGRDVYVSAAGSATDFYSRSLGDSDRPLILHTDTEGGFTALSPWQSYVVFFKEDRIYRLLGSRADSFVLQDSHGVGIPAELASTLCDMGNALYYCAAGGLYRYRGQEPERVSSFGEVTVLGGCGGSDGQAYYLSVETEQGWRMGFYLPDKGVWYPEDGLCAACMLTDRGFLAIQDDSGHIWMTSSDGRKPSCPFDERQTVGPVTASATLKPDHYGEPDGYRLTGLYIRATGENGGILRVYGEYADGNTPTDADGRGELLLAELRGGRVDRLTRIPLPSRRCDGMTLRLEAVGAWEIHAVLREYERGRQ